MTAQMVTRLTLLRSNTKNAKSLLIAMETAAVRHLYPTVNLKHRNKGYFDQNVCCFFFISNVSQFIQKAYIIINKVQKFQLLAD